MCATAKVDDEQSGCTDVRVQSMRTRSASFSLDPGALAAIGILALGLWVALSLVINGRALAPSYPGSDPLPAPTAQAAPTNAAPLSPPSAAPANTNEEPASSPAAPGPSKDGVGTQPAGPGLVDPAQADPYPPKPRFDEPIDQPITNVKPIYIGEGK